MHPSRQQVINWISEAWSSTLPDTIVKSFLRCGISNSMDESQNDKLLDHFPLDEAETRQEAASLLFSDSKSDFEFEGFNDSDLDD